MSSFLVYDGHTLRSPFATPLPPRVEWAFLRCSCWMIVCVMECVVKSHLGRPLSLSDSGSTPQIQTSERDTLTCPLLISATSIDAAVFGGLTSKWRRSARPRAVSRERKARAWQRHFPNGDARGEWPVSRTVRLGPPKRPKMDFHTRERRTQKRTDWRLTFIFALVFQGIVEDK